MRIDTTWPFQTRDACADFFGTALRAYAPDVPATARVLEIGCAEYDWLTPAATAWPEMSFTGIDWRGWKKAPTSPRVRIVQGDTMQAETFPEAAFDWIVSISAIEHVGLGHYAKDPVAEDGDTRAWANAWHWLAPGGFVYFDVPWNAGSDQYQVCGTSHRTYDDAALETRCFAVCPGARRLWRGVVARTETTRLLTETPTLTGGGKDFYYIGFWLQKPGGRHAP